MKRIISLLLITIFLLCLTGCGGQEQEVNAGGNATAAPVLETSEAGHASHADGSGAAQTAGADDTAAPKDPNATPAPESGRPSGADGVYDYRQNLIGGSLNVLETEDTVYFKQGDVVYFTDREYKEWMPLCPRPECSHDNEDCNANLACCSDIWLYGDYIWFVANMEPERVEEGEYQSEYAAAELWRMRLDGTQHEKVCDLPMPEPEGYKTTTTFWKVQWHNKYLVVTYRATGALGGAQTSQMYYYVLDLDTHEAKFFTYKNMPWEFDDCTLLYGEGDKAYVLGSFLTKKPPELTPEEMEELGIESIDEIWPTFGDYTKYVGVLDCATGELRYIGSVDKDIWCMGGSFAFIEDRMDYLSYPGGEMQRHRFDLNTGKDELIETIPLVDLKYETYDWANGLWFRIYEYHPTDEDQSITDQWGVYFYDSNFNPVCSTLYNTLNADEYEAVTGLTVKFQTDSFIFAVGVRVNEDGITYVPSDVMPDWYIDKAELASGSPVWHRWEP